MSRLSRFISAVMMTLAILPSVAFSWSSSKKYKILSMDGGGIRGVISTQIIKMLDDEFDFVKNIDLFAGTSTGSLMTAGFSFGLTPSKMVELYTVNGKDIFVEAHDFDPLQLHAQYSPAALESVLNDITNHSHPKLSDLKKKVVITSFKLHDEKAGRWHPVNFQNYTKCNEYLIDVVLRSSAAPMFFPSHQGYVDGGFVANDPSLIALCSAIDPTMGGQDLSNIAMLSVGTSEIIDDLGIENDVDWGFEEWVVYNPYHSKKSPSNVLITLIQDSASQMASQQTRDLLGDSYCRITPAMDHRILLDDYKSAQGIVEEVKQWPKTRPEYWNSLREWVKNNFVD